MTREGDARRHAGFETRYLDRRALLERFGVRRTYSRIAAEILRAGISGERDPNGDLYAFG